MKGSGVAKSKILGCASAGLEARRRHDAVPVLRLQSAPDGGVSDVPDRLFQVFNGIDEWTPVVSRPRRGERAVRARVLGEGVKTFPVQLHRRFGLHVRGDAIDVLRVGADD